MIPGLKGLTEDTLRFVFLETLSSSLAQEVPFDYDVTCVYGNLATKETVIMIDVYFVILVTINPLSPSIKLQVVLLCFRTILTEVVRRSC